MDNNESFERFKREDEELRKAIGIESGYRPRLTIYNEASRTLIASVERHSDGVFERRLFYRHVSERVYRQLGSPASEIHLDNPITSSALPVIYYTVTLISKRKAPGEFGGDWLSVERYDLKQHRSESVITKGGLKLPEPYSRGWISKLFSVGADDSAVLCSCGLERPEKGRVHYWLCSVEPRTQRVALLSKLEGVWF